MVIPARLIRDELFAAGCKIIEVREYGERFIEHPTITSPRESRSENGKTVTIYAKYDETVTLACSG